LSIAEVCERVEAHPRRLERLFAHWLGTSPKRFYQRCRLEKARALLMHSNLPIIDVAQMTGFATHSQFSVVFRRHFGETPTSLRRNTPDIAHEAPPPSTGCRRRLVGSP
jgi:transcriptional regulator GlxA family with amidase domain